MSCNRRGTCHFIKSVTDDKTFMILLNGTKKEKKKKKKYNLLYPTLLSQCQNQDRTGIFQDYQGAVPPKSQAPFNHQQKYH